MQEIERKWRIEKLPAELGSYPFKPMVASYFKDKKGETIRIRQEGDGQEGTKYLRVKKSGHGLVRGNGPKGDVEITKKEFDELWPRTDGWRIWKTRYYIPYGKYVIEFDIYRDFPRFYTAEVEFETVEEANQFIPPDWFGKELTNDSGYSNSNLALYGVPKDANIPEFSLSDGIVELSNMVADKLVSAGEFIAAKPVIIQIAGGSASGKTSQVTLKIKELFGSEAVIIAMDDYYRGNTFMKNESAKGNILNWDQPEALDLELLNEHLKALQANMSIQKPVYDFKIGERIGTEKVKPAKVIIVEGLFALNDSVTQEDTIRVFVNIGFHGRILRRLLRDVERTGQKPADILDYFARVVEPMHEKHVQSTKENADIIINNEYCPAVEAQKSGPHEIQVKFRTNLTGEDLRKKGAEKLAVVVQTDYYYNPKDRNLADTNETLRIRRDERDRWILTYKGPRVSSEFRKRPKFEFEIDTDTVRVFLALYGDKVRTIQKDRELYYLDGVVFSLDHNVVVIDGNSIDESGERLIGRFLEIRSTNSSEGGEDRIKKILIKLGLDFSQSILGSYFEM